MSEQIKLGDLLKSLPVDASASAGLLAVDSLGNLSKALTEAVAKVAFSSLRATEDMDSPTARGIFYVDPSTRLTRPKKGRGWSYAYLLNLAAQTGVQVLVSFSGDIAVRGKGSAGGEWNEWCVMQTMA